MGAGRRLHEGQKIHSSAEPLTNEYIPNAVLATTGEKPDWQKIFASPPNTTYQGLCREADLLDIAKEVVEQFLEDNADRDDDDAWLKVGKWLQFGEQTAT